MFRLFFLTLSLVLLSACGSGGSANSKLSDPLVVNSTEDSADPPEGVVTLRSAIASAKSGDVIRFAPELDGQIISLTIVGEAHSILRGEVMGMRMEESGPVSYLEGWFERDYGKSALYARKDLHLDASELDLGVHIQWDQSGENARVLAVYGDLTLNKVTISGGNNVAEEILTDESSQLWSLSRGGGVAVWGTARIYNCRIYNNSLVGDFGESRDRGAFGGGVYANVLEMEDSQIHSNQVMGAGAAGGGVYVVNGASLGPGVIAYSTIERSSISGNRISGLFTYGGGVFSEGGGIGEANRLLIYNSTLARNLVEPAVGLPPFLLGMGYWRGGGAYISNGMLSIHASTVVENQVHGWPRTDSNSRPNLAGAVAATVGNAHAVEDMVISRSIIAGNTVHPSIGTPYPEDIFTGSLVHFRSGGYNRIGTLNFSQILVPVGEPRWKSLSRKHFPQQGDLAGVTLEQIVELDATLQDEIHSAGVLSNELLPILYPPTASALDQVPFDSYLVPEIYAEYEVAQGGVDDFLAIFLERLESHLGVKDFASSFTQSFESYLQTVDTDEETVGVQPHLDEMGNPILALADTHWFGPSRTWPKEVKNYAYINFWHQLDAELKAQVEAGNSSLGQELLGESEWQALFDSGPLAENPDLNVAIIEQKSLEILPLLQDQLGQRRNENGPRDIGAVEQY